MFFIRWSRCWLSDRVQAVGQGVEHVGEDLRRPCLSVRGAEPGSVPTPSDRAGTGAGAQMLVRGRDLAQSRRLETGLIGLRWFVVMLGGTFTFLTVQDANEVPGYAVPLGARASRPHGAGGNSRPCGRDRLRPVQNGSAFLTIVDDTEVVPPKENTSCFGS